MNKATRYVVGVLAVALAVAGTIAILQILMGERSESYALPVAFLGGSGLGLWFALYFGTGLPVPDGSASEEDSLPTAAEDGDHAG